MTPAALPHLDTALDGAAMAAVFAAVRPGVQACRVDRVKLRPGRNATVSYRLMVHGREQIVATRWCRDGEAAPRFRRQPQDGSVTHFPSLDMLAWWWPADAKLAAPRALADRRMLHQQLLPEVAAMLGMPRPDGHHLRVVQYVPESRVCARVQLSWADGRHAVLYAKASREPSAEQANRILQRLQGQPGLAVPFPVLWQPGPDLHWQLGAPGRPWLDLPADAQRALAPRLGEQLAALHTAPVAAPRVLDAAVLRAQLTVALQALHDALPQAAELLAALADRLQAGIGDWAGGPAATLHGDLHPRNVLADGTRLTLIDLDGLRQGPAVLELGAWRADAIYRALLAGRADDDLGWPALLQAYVAAGGTRPQPQALAWACAWALAVQRAWRCVVNLKPGRTAIVHALLLRAARIADVQALEAA